jgi:hypothetical protein
VSRSERLVLLGLVLALVGLLQDRLPLLPWVVGLALVLLGVGISIRDWRRVVRADRQFVWVKADSGHIMGRVMDELSVVYPSGGAVFVPADEAGSWCDAPASLTDEPYRLPVELASFRSAALAFYRSEGKRLTNDWTVGLSHVGPDGAVLMPVRYFDFACSNDLGRWTITEKATRHRRFDVLGDYVLDLQARLRPFGETQLSDNVGISTAALTRDGRLVLVHQSRGNAINEGELAASGSGSLEPIDTVISDGSPPTLRRVVTQGMEREMREEILVGPDEILETRVVGVARWVARGAKPEFLGVTRLSCTSTELRSRHHRTSEKDFSDGLELVDIGVGPDASWGVLLDRLAAVDVASHGVGSVSLLMILSACRDSAVCVPGART